MEPFRSALPAHTPECLFRSRQRKSTFRFHPFPIPNRPCCNNVAESLLVFPQFAFGVKLAERAVHNDSDSDVLNRYDEVPVGIRRPEFFDDLKFGIRHHEIDGMPRVNWMISAA